MTDAELVAQVTACIQEAIRKNRRAEVVLIVMLSALFVAGLSFLGLGLAARDWTLALPGGLCELAIAWPIRNLIKLRRENILLEILPNTVRLSNAEGRRRLVGLFVERLIEQV